MAVKKLFDHLNAITAEQDPNYFDKLSEEDLKSWSNFMINRFLSMKPEWVELIASLLPLTQTLRPKEMYKLYINVLPKEMRQLKDLKHLDIRGVAMSYQKYNSYLTMLKSVDLFMSEPCDCQE